MIQTCFIKKYQFKFKPQHPLLLKSRCFLTETGTRLSKWTGQSYDKNLTYVSTDNGQTWTSLIALANLGESNHQLNFLTHQLDLFEKLAFVSVALKIIKVQSIIKVPINLVVKVGFNANCTISNKQQCNQCGKFPNVCVDITYCNITGSQCIHKQDHNARVRILDLGGSI